MDKNGFMGIVVNIWYFYGGLPQLISTVSYNHSETF